LAPWFILEIVPGPADHRPNPEELLRRVQADERREQRGRLKVFLGYASRVGKSLRMFDEGRRRKLRGQDVVVGAVQGAVTPDVQEILAGIEIIPTVPEKHGGVDYQVIDLAALFRRHPGVCLIDGLAYFNPPGSRNPERWQDVEELLDRGIAVITAVNVQHIREKQDEVERITAKRASDSIPEEFLLEADEIEVVDAPPDALIGRSDGMTPGSRELAELRELALLLAADVVDRQLQYYLDSHGITASWGTQERILICLTPRSNAADMLKSGLRNKLRFHGALVVAYVEQNNLSAEDKSQLDSHLAAAREMGAEIHCLKGDDFAGTILEFAREQRITQLFLGHSGRPSALRLMRGPIDRLIDAAEDFDVRLFPHPEAK
jgi:two-component system, OmpR family, sensor histidine kinase KdpD